MENYKFIDITQLPEDLWQDAKNLIAIDSNGEVIKAEKQDSYSKDEIDDLLKDAEISADKLQNKIQINSAITDYVVTQPTVSGDSLLITDAISDKNQYHTFGYDKTITTTSNKLLDYSTPLFRGANEYNCPQWDGNSIRFTNQAGYKFKTRLTIPYTYNGVKYVTHFDIDIKSQTYQLNFGVINDPKFAGYQSVKFKESEVYKAFGANGTFVFKTNNIIKDYAILSYDSTYDFIFDGNKIEMTIGNFPLTASNGALIIETPRFYISENNFIYGDVPTESQSSDHPEHLNDYIRYSNDVKAYILTDKNTKFKTINGEHITGDGDITIDTNVDLSNYATKSELNTKQDTLVSGTNIKSINGTSLLSSGDIELATKEELNTKQNVISDLDTIRSGAALGATALQSVPSEYAKKTDILSAKTDERYTDYEVQNPVLSGKTILLQNEVTDSRKYHTLGYDKTITESVPVQKYINITRGYNGVPSMDTNIEDVIDFSVDSDGVGHMYSQITFTLDKIKNATNLMHYEVSYPERDSEGNVTGCGEQVVADVTYDPNTKLLSVPGTEFAFAQIRRSDKNTYLFGGGTDGTEYFENGRTYYNFEQNPLQEGATLTWYISCTTPYQYCDYSVTINGLFYQEGSVTTDDKPERLNDYIRYANNVKAYILTDKNTTFKTINGQQITGNGDITIDTNVDLSNYATKAELATKQDVISDLVSIRSGAALGATALQSVPSEYATEQWVNEQGFLKEHQDISNLATKQELATKQDTLVSGTNIKTINGTSLLGSGDITIEGGSGNVDLTDYYTKSETNALVSPKLSQVTLTQAEYDALQTKEENVLYVISDAEDIKFKTINGAQITGEGNIELATKEELNAKQDVISDLDSIRSGAAKGATALQSVPSTYALKSEIPDITTKQDTLVSGTNIKTINGTSLLGSGNIEVAKEWIGTQAQYDALSTKDNNTTYYITE